MIYEERGAKFGQLEPPTSAATRPRCTSCFVGSWRCPRSPAHYLGVSSQTTHVRRRTAGRGGHP